MRLPDLEADGDGFSVAVDDDLDAVGEVDGVAVVELGGERAICVEGRLAQRVLDGLPVDRVVHVTVEVDVARTERPGAARCRPPAEESSSRVDTPRPPVASA